jgi:hypothetical protein
MERRRLWAFLRGDFAAQGHMLKGELQAHGAATAVA